MGIRQRVKWFAQAWGALALSTALAACGSTVDGARSTGQSPASAGGTSTGVTPTGLALDDSPSGGALAPAAAGAPSGGAQRRLSPSSSPGTVAPPSTVVPREAADGPGVTSSTITFGVPYVVNSDEANEALGAGEFDGGDTRRYYNAVVDEVNRSGGVAGRKLVPSYYAVSAGSPQSADQQTNAACQHWTRDVKAFVFFDALNELARSCAEKHGMVSIGSGTGGTAATTSTFARYPHHLEPSGIRIDALAAETASGLAGTDYYGKAPVLGVVTWDNDAYRYAIAHGLRPALARLGLKVAVASYVQVPETMGGLSGSSASVSSAILRFRQAGVTHAFVLDGPAGVALGTVLTLMWIKAAGSQSYYPRYGFNDNNSPGSGLWGAEEMPGARFVSMVNASTYTDTGVGVNRRRTDCLALMKRHGMVPGNSNAQGYMLHACDNVLFLRAVLGTTKTAVNRERFVALADALGPAYQSPVTYRVRLAPGRHDGVAAFRRLRLDDGCGCFVYSSGLYSRD